MLNIFFVLLSGFCHASLYHLSLGLAMGFIAPTFLLLALREFGGNARHGAGAVGARDRAKSDVVIKGPEKSRRLFQTVLAYASSKNNSSSQLEAIPFWISIESTG
jgi:hypothetical protein